jgi:tight adherence protein C
LVACTAAAGLGFVLPTWVLEKMAASRGNKIIRQMPNMLDLLVVAVESGLGLDAAVLRVTKDLGPVLPHLVRGTGSVSAWSCALGATREDALKNLSRRTGVDDMSGLVAMLVQADRFGVSVGRSLRVFANEMRTKRRQKLEEMAAKIPLKLLIPVLFMIFPRHYGGDGWACGY